MKDVNFGTVADGLISSVFGVIYIKKKKHN